MGKTYKYINNELVEYIDADEAVRVVPQTFTDTEKAQARTNIGASDGSHAVNADNATHATNASDSVHADNADNATTAETITGAVETKSNFGQGIITLKQQSGTHSVKLYSYVNDETENNEVVISFYNGEACEGGVNIDSTGYANGLTAQNANKVNTSTISPTAQITQCGLYAVTAQIEYTGLHIVAKCTVMISIENLSVNAYGSTPYNDGTMDTSLNILYQADNHILSALGDQISSVRLITAY